MISKEIEAKILRLHTNEKWNVGAIAKHLRVHHSTVSRVLGEIHEQGTMLVVRPSILDPFLPFMRETLEKYPSITASRMWRMCTERGYNGGQDHFREVTSRLRPRKIPEAFLRLSTLPGEQGQVDWAHFGKIKIGRIERPLVAFVIVLSYSRQIFLSFHLSQETGVFLAAHEAAFQAFGGVPRVLLYDNLKSAVIERQGEYIRMNERMLAFASHYRFEPRPVGVRKGNEKGRVERAIGYIRTSFFAGTEYANLADLNRKAAEWCLEVAAKRIHHEDDSLTVKQAWEKEKELLLALPNDLFPTHTTLGVRIGKTPYARVDANDYTVPHIHVQKEISAMMTENEIIFCDQGTEIARHQRSWGRGERIENAAHIAELWERKKRAKGDSATERVQAQVPASREFLEHMHKQGGNIGGIICSLGNCIEQYGAATVEKAVRLVLVSNRISLHHVRSQLERISIAEGRSAHLLNIGAETHTEKVSIQAPQPLQAWDRLTQKGAEK